MVESKLMPDQYAELREYLVNLGQSAAEIELILARVQEYENATQHDSIMDSIGNGTLDLAAIIKEALGEKP
jgi:ABC-type phosphate/phosphonate transport system substrate-binding protein